VGSAGPYETRVIKAHHDNYSIVNDPLVDGLDRKLAWPWLAPTLILLS
jgi:hypothetical protein